jgi:hypothetical protein
MFCPKCGCEYREGFTECADCRVPLTDEAPPPEPGPKPEYADFVSVMATSNLMDIAIIKAILSEEEIPFFFDGEGYNMIQPFVQPARLFVPRDRAEEAVKVLKTLRLKYLAFSGLGSSDEFEEDD